MLRKEREGGGGGGRKKQTKKEEWQEEKDTDMETINNNHKKVVHFLCVLILVFPARVIFSPFILPQKKNFLSILFVFNYDYFAEQYLLLF